MLSFCTNSAECDVRNHDMDRISSTKMSDNRMSRIKQSLPIWNCITLICLVIFIRISIHIQGDDCVICVRESI